jgi:hypothetical protein
MTSALSDFGCNMSEKNNKQHVLVPLEIDDNCWDRVVTQAQAPKSRKRPVGKQLSPIPVAATSFPASQLWKSSYPWVFFFKEFTRWREITRYTHSIPSVLRSISEDMRCQIPFASEIKAFARNTPDVVFFSGLPFAAEKLQAKAWLQAALGWRHHQWLKMGFHRSGTNVNKYCIFWYCPSWQSV